MRAPESRKKDETAVTKTSHGSPKIPWTTRAKTRFATSVPPGLSSGSFAIGHPLTPQIVTVGAEVCSNLFRMAAIDDLVGELERSYAEAQGRMSDPAVYNDHKQAADAGRRLKELEGPHKLA
jgi:hypothetical protein